jgi:hypothetical protein
MILNISFQVSHLHARELSEKEQIGLMENENVFYWNRIKGK